MALTVEEIMNRELFHLHASDDARTALSDLQALGIGSAPVLDGARHPLGVASLSPRLTGGAAKSIAFPMGRSAQGLAAQRRDLNLQSRSV